MSSSGSAFISNPSTAHIIGSSDVSDGRRLKRERNIAIVREAVIELLAEGTEPRIGQIARRSGVTTRSIYRYFGDAQTAIVESIAHRRRQAIDVFENEPGINVGSPFEERLAMLVLRRLRLGKVIDPIGDRLDLGEFSDALDSEVTDAFAPELPSDSHLAKIVCAVLRLQAVGEMRDAFDDDEVETAGAIRRLVSTLLVSDDADAAGSRR